jgi:hypothetical protein
MKKYRKLPVEIEAVQLTEQNIKEVYELVHNQKIDTSGRVASEKWDDYCNLIIDKGGLIIPTLEDGKNKEAKHFASIGDYIIRGVAGEFYPCKPEIFKQTYEAI